MKQLEVYIGHQHAGTLSNDKGDYLFSYSESYTGPPLSLSMPKTQKDYQGRRVYTWFDNILPDNPDVRKSMAKRAGTTSGVFSLLAHYGLDLPGAIQVVSEETNEAFLMQPSNYVALSEDEISKRLNSLIEDERHYRISSWVAKEEHWSLGGYQTKLALKEEDGAWYSCQGSAASNVIVKPGISYLLAQALDECATMRLALRCELPTAPVRMHRFGDIWTIVIERFDRVINEDGTIQRIHQEDMCQALGYSPLKKYAEEGGPSSPPIYKLIESFDKAGCNRFFDALLFNYLTASNDAHAKNYSILHFGENHSILAPLYDVASMAPYMDPNRPQRKAYRLAMSIGGENRVGHLRKTPLQRFARITGMDEAWLFNRSYELIARVEAQLEGVFSEPDLVQVENIDELASRYIPRVKKICQSAERNLSRTGANYYVPNIPKAAK